MTCITCKGCKKVPMAGTVVDCPDCDGTGEQCEKCGYPPTKCTCKKGSETP